MVSGERLWRAVLGCASTPTLGPKGGQGMPWDGGNTPLCLAANRGKKEVVQILLEAGPVTANISAPIFFSEGAFVCHVGRSA